MVSDATKDKFITELERVPLIAAACRVAGVVRSSVYRWRLEDEDFAKRMDAALEFGRSDVNDLAESKLIQALKKGESWAIRYWLEFNKREYYKPRSPIAAPKPQRVISTVKIQVVNTDGSYKDEKGVEHPPILKAMDPVEFEESRPQAKLYRLKPPDKP